MSNLRTISIEEVAQNNSEDSCWIIMNGKVYDVTKFADEHPGGSEVIRQLAGTDCTSDFEDVGHSKDALVMAEEYLIGQLPQADVSLEEDTETKKEATSSWFSGLLSNIMKG